MNNIKSIEQDLLILLREILSEEQITILRGMNYFTAPASSKYHLNVKTGLMRHSYNVVTQMFKLQEVLNLNITRKDILIVGLFHDLNKCYAYVPNWLKDGSISSKIPYKRTPTLEGDGGLSAFLCSQNLKLELTPIQYHGIAFHNYLDDYYINVASKKLKEGNHIKSIQMLWLIQSSDRLCSDILE